MSGRVIPKLITQNWKKCFSVPRNPDAAAVTVAGCWAKAARGRAKSPLFWTQPGVPLQDGSRMKLIGDEPHEKGRRQEGGADQPGQLFARRGIPEKEEKHENND